MNKALRNWVFINCINTCVIGVLKGEEQKKEAERIFKETVGEMLTKLAEKY